MVNYPRRSNDPIRLIPQDGMEEGGEDSSSSPVDASGTCARLWSPREGRSSSSETMFETERGMVASLCPRVSGVCPNMRSHGRRSAGRDQRLSLAGLLPSLRVVRSDSASFSSFLVAM